MLLVWHNQGYAEEQPDACYGLYGKATGTVLSFYNLPVSP